MVSDPLSERGTVRGGKGGAEHDLRTPVVPQQSVKPTVRLSHRICCCLSVSFAAGLTAFLEAGN